LVDTEVGAIKTKTDQLTFTVANQIDANTLTIGANVVTASALATDAVNEIVDQVWDELLSGHTGAGSTGAGLSAAGAAGDPWSTALPGSYGAGTAGKIVGDNVNATISSRASQTSLDTLDDLVDTEVGAIKTKTDQLTFTVANQVDSNSLSVSATGIRTAVGMNSANLDSQIATLATPTNITAGTITTVTNLTNAPTSGDLTSTMKASVTAAVPTAVQIQSGLATPTNITAGTITTVTNLTNAPTSGDLTATMKSSVTAAVPTVVQIQSGLATPTNITAGTISTVTNLTNAPTSGDLTATMKSSVTAAVPTAAQNFAAVLTTALTESYAADNTAPTLAQAIMLIQQSLHEFAINSTTRTVKKLDGSTTAATFTLDSATAPTSTTRAT
jgi:hypothetical protein